MLIEFFLIIVLNFLLRLLFLISKGSDDFVHYWNISQRRELKSSIKQNVTNSLIKGKRGYPVFNHYLISLFPKKYWTIVGKFLNILYDLLVLIVFYFVVNSLYMESNIVDFSYGFWATMILGTSSILFPINARLQAMGARTAGFFLIFLYNLFFSYYFVYDPNLLLVVPMILVGILILMTSQFGTQFFIFYNLFMTILLQNMLPIGNILIILIIARLVPRLGLWEIVKFKLAHNKWYINNLKGTTAETKNNFLDFVMLPIYVMKDRKKFFKVMFIRNSYVYTIFNLPLFFYLIIVTFVGDFRYNEIDNFIFYTLIAFLIILILTSHKPFIIFGEAERYFEYVTPFVSFYLIYLIDMQVVEFKVLLVFLFLNIIVIILNLLLINRNFILENLRIESNSSYLELIRFLKTQENLNILSIPIKSTFRLSVDIPEFKYYYRHINQDKKGFDYFSNDTQSLEIPNFDWPYFYKTYGVNTLIVANDYRKNIEGNTNGLLMLYENQDYTIYKIYNDKK